MKSYKTAVPALLSLVFLVGPIAYGQVTQNPPGPRLLERLKLVKEQDYVYSFQARGGGVRGALAGAAGGAWWTNRALVERLGLSEEQKAKIERAFENHRQKIVSSTELLEKEEAQLARLLEAETIDRNAVLSQVDRVAQARGEMERANSAMTLEMRESLTRAQWMQLQTPTSTFSISTVRIGGNVTASNLISQVEPIYPDLAKQAGIQGTVILEAEITKEGTVGSLKVISGHPLLQQAAIDAVKQWRYRPTLMNNEPVSAVTTVTVRFPFSAARGGRGGAAVAPVPQDGGGARRGRPQ